MTPLDDPTATLDLLRRHATGDREALAELLRRELPWLREFVSRRLGAHLRAKDETMDQVQDAMVDFLRDAPRFVVGDLAQFRALLARVVENNLRDRDAWFRARRRAMAAEQPLPSESVLQIASDSVTTPTQAAAESEWRAWVRLAMELMDPADRRLLVLREWDARSFVEIGELEGMTPNAVRMRWTRAVARLADRIEKLRRGELA
ncbi:MAG: sigma-70 family RNA polymerase sigma factor [Planctomycetes bacterium]|nr:sigma-70 family RNA polymerase sigma factor [Planctomycetota bacterium]